MGSEMCIRDSVGTMRASAVTTRRCVAQALWNICTPSTLEALIASSLAPPEEEEDPKKKPKERTNAMAFAHAFGLLAAQDDEQTLELVAALFAATCMTADGRKMLVLAKNKVLHGAYTLLRSKTRSTRLTAGLAACNLLRDSGTSKEAARTGALHVVRVLSVQGDDAASLACCGALAAITGRGDEDQIKLVARDGAAPVPVHLALTHDVLVARAAVRTIACLAIHECLRGPLVKAGAPTALVGACLRDAKDRDANADAVARGMLYLSASPELVPDMVAQRSVAGLAVLGKHVARRRHKGDANATARLADVPKAVVACLRRFAADPSVHEQLVIDGGAACVAQLCIGPGNDIQNCARDAAAFFCDIARTASLASDLGRDQSGAALLALSSQSSVSDDQSGQWRVLRALFDLTHYDPQRRGDLVNSGCCLAVEKLSTTANVQARQCAAACLCYLSEHKPSRPRMVSDGAVDALVRAAEDTRANDVTKHWCAVALANLSAETEVSKGDVAALLEAVHPDVVFFDGRLTESAIALARVAETRGIRVLVECERMRDGLDELVRLADVVVTSKNYPLDRFTETKTLGDAMTEMFACLPKAKVMVTTLGARGAVALVRDGVETPEVGEGTALDDVVSRLEIAALRGDDETPGPSVETESLVIRDASGERRFKAKVVFTPTKRLTDNQVVDTTGAGDAFIGTLAMSACSEDFNVAGAMRLGAYVAATKCGGIGARSALPHRKDIPESLFEEFPLKSASSRRAAIFSLVLAGLSSLAEPATAADEVDTKKLTELFNRAMQATTYEESEAIWTKAIELSPEGSRARSAAFSNRGTLRLQYQEWQGAVDDLQASVDLDGNNPDPLSLNNLGNAKGALNQWDSAMADFLEASRTEDMRAIALANYALAAFQTERDDLAITTARKLLRRDPEFLDMRAALSAFLWSEGRFDDAEAEWTFLCKSGRGFGAKRSAEEKRDAGAIAYGFELFTQSANQIVAELDGGVKDAGLDTPCRLYKTTDTVANRWPPRATAALDAFLRVRGDGQALDYDGRVKTFNFRH